MKKLDKMTVLVPSGKGTFLGKVLFPFDVNGYLAFLMPRFHLGS